MGELPVKWNHDPQEHDFPAAVNYLRLVLDDVTVTRVVDALRRQPTETHKAKDILRASGLGLLGRGNPHVDHDLAKIAKGTPLSPVLLVRGDAHRGAPLTIADGYHRVCASYLVDENTDIPCRLVGLEPVAPALAPAPRQG